MIYKFDQRVYLRRDPSQFGHIGVGMFGGNLDSTGTRQFVFWEHKDADIVTAEPIVDLMSGDEYHERRRLFFAAMRHPEMRILLVALQHLHIDKDIDWQAIKSIQMERYGWQNDCWMLTTDRFITVTLWADKPDLSIYDFSTYLLHDENDPMCDCNHCQEERICHVHLKHRYIAQE